MKRNHYLLIFAIGVLCSCVANKNIVLSIPKSNSIATIVYDSPFSITSVSLPTNGTYRISDTSLSFTLVYSDNAYVNGAPRLKISLWDKTVYADYVSGSGTNSLVFTYTIASGDDAPRGISITELELNNGTIKDSNNKNISLTLPTTITSSIVLSACKAGYVKVKANTDVGATNDFCIMKHEVRRNDGQISNATLTSPLNKTGAGAPWGYLNQSQAETVCANDGAGVHLVTNEEWMAAARGIEERSENWNSAMTKIAHGFTDHTLQPTQYGLEQGLAANSNDGIGCSGYSPAVNCNVDLTNSDTVAAWQANFNENRRTHFLSTGNIIWDFAGNVREIVNMGTVAGERLFDIFSLTATPFFLTSWGSYVTDGHEYYSTSLPGFDAGSLRYQQVGSLGLYQLTGTNSLPTSQMGPLFRSARGVNQYNSTNGMGTYKQDANTNNITGCRGGRFIDDNGDLHLSVAPHRSAMKSGIYSLDFHYYSCWCTGFRCAYNL